MRRAILLLLAAQCAHVESGPTAPPVPPTADADAMRRAEGDPFVVLERTACYGMCPVYRVTVFPSGHVLYEGFQYVAYPGAFRGVDLTEQQLHALDYVFLRADFCNLEASYERVIVTDQPGAYLAYHPRHGSCANGSVRHYHGDSHAPEGLRPLENRIDEVVGIDRYIGSKAYRLNTFPTR